MTGSTLLVIGATGSIGRHVVPVAMAKGYAVRALIRDPARAGLPPAVTLVQGDLTAPHTLPPALDGVDAVVFVHGSTGGEAGSRETFYAGVRDVLAALGPRVVPVALMTAIAVTDRGRAHDWKRRAERLIRASGLPYLIVRPGWFDMNGARQDRPVLLQGDRRRSGTPRDGVVARRQVAQVLVAGLEAGGPPGRTVELVAETGAAPPLMPLIAAADPDRSGALDGVDDEANMPMDAEPAAVLADLERLRVRRG